MAEEAQNPSQHPNILNKTLAEVLQGNPTAQNIVMSAMQISPQQFQQLVGLANNNQLMNQTIGDLFKNGTMQQATGQAVQLNPQQFQQMLGVMNQQNTSEQQVQPTQAVTPDTVPYVLPAATEKPSFLQKLKGFLK